MGDWFKNLIGDTPARLERYFNFTAVAQGAIAGLLVVIAITQLTKRK